MKNKKGQALIEFLIAGTMALTLAYLTTIISFKIFFNTLLSDWVDEHFLCYHSQSARLKSSEICTEKLKKKLQLLKPTQFNLHHRHDILSIELQHPLLDLPPQIFIARCPLPVC